MNPLSSSSSTPPATKSPSLATMAHPLAARKRARADADDPSEAACLNAGLEIENQGHYALLTLKHPRPGQTVDHSTAAGMTKTHRALTHH
jgi:hypothetical protein